MPPRPRWVHVAALVLVLAGALALSERSTGFTVDEGSYAIQAEALRDGSWEIEWPFRSVDPDGDHFPYHGGRVTDEGEYAYVAHPSWPVALSWVTRVVPEHVGLRLLSMVGVVGAALAAGALASRLAGRSAWAWGFWVAGASPLLPDGLMAWAHAPAAALAGGALVAALALLDEGARARWHLVLVPCVAGGVLLRSELLLFAGALALGLAAWSFLRRIPIAWRLALEVGAAAAGAVTIERGMVRLIAGEGSAADLSSRGGRDGGGWLAGRIEGFGSAVLDGSLRSGGAALCSLLAMVLVGVAAVVVLRGRGDLRPAPLLWAAAGLTAVRLVTWPDDVVPGLVTAFPVLVVALVAWRGAPPLAALLAGVTAVFTVAVVATQYDDGGGLQWGGRYLAPAIVPLAALVAVAVVQHLDPSLRAPLAALVGVAAVFGLWATNEVRQRNAAGLDAVSAVGADSVLVAGDHLARLDWEAWPERCWLAGEPGQPADAVAVLREAGSGYSAYLGYLPEELESTGAAVEPLADGAAVGRVGDGPSPRRCPGANMRSLVVAGR